MYIPSPFRVDDPALLHEFMRRYSFATLISEVDGAPFATHLPLLLDAERGPNGVLRSHMARANPHWRTFGEAQKDVLVLFQGPHAYVSPSWYEAKISVPTWNYAVVHAYGIPRLLGDSAELYRLLSDLVIAHESPRENPWAFDLPPEEIEKLMRAIVGFEIEITRLEGKFKLNQNRPAEDRRNVASALGESSDSVEREVAKMMEGLEDKRQSPGD